MDVAPRVPQTSHRKFGYNIGVSTTEVEVRSEDADYAYQSANVSIEALSGSTSDLGIARGTLTLVSAIAGDLAVVNGVTYTAVAGVPANFTEFSIDTSDTLAAASLAAAINGDTTHDDNKTVPTAEVVATSALGVVTIEVDGTIGNLVDISSIDSTITASGATLTDAGTGAHSITVIGLNLLGEEVEETVFLDGTDVVAFTSQFAIVFRAVVLEVGSGGANAGLITVRVASAGALQITIPILQGQSQITNVRVPINRKLTFHQWGGTVGSAAANAVVVLVQLWVRSYGQSWRLIDRAIEQNGNFTRPLDINEEELGPLGDVKITADKLTGTGDAEVEADYSYILS